MLSKYLAPRSERAYALLRIAFGLLFSFHGAQKIFGSFVEDPSSLPAFPSQIWFGGMIELVGGLAIASGLFATCAAFLASGTMAVAYVQFHWMSKAGDVATLQFGKGFFPGINGGEMALLYSFAFLYMACKGSGVWSLDSLRSRKSPPG